MKLLQATTLFTLLTFISAQRYLFLSASITVKRLLDKPVRNKTYTHVTSIDQHLFANAKEIKVRTSAMFLMEGAVKNLPHLKVLRLKQCGIDKLPPKTFKNLPNLRTLHLQENQISVVENNVFNFMGVKELWLQKNQISEIRSGAFDNMPNLEVVKLNKNWITKWDSRWFANTPKLTQILFRKNKITELPRHAFANLQSSHKVNNEELVDLKIFLSSNKINNIHPQAFEGLDSIDELCLRKNKLEDIDEEVFAHFSELHKLNLTRNFLSRIDESMFRDLSEMFELDLSDNFIKCVPYELAKKVDKIFLSGNEEMECSCIKSLQEKLEEDSSDNQVFGDACE